MRIIVERSHRHLHLTVDTAIKLLGDRQLNLRPLSVRGQFATDAKVHVPCLGDTSILYPWRDYDQLEVSMNEYRRMLGVYTPRLQSGDVYGRPTVLIGGVEIPVIVPHAHVHLPRLNERVQAQLNGFYLPLDIKFNETVDDQCYMHLDDDQYNAVRGYSEEYDWRFGWEWRV